MYKSLKKSEHMFVTEIPLRFKLSDHVVCYADSDHVRVISLDLFNKYPVIYDTINGKEMSIVVCPYTLASCVYEAELEMEKGENKCSVVVEKQSGKKFFVINGHHNINRYEVTIKTIRNVFRDHVHATYLELVNKKKETKKKEKKIVSSKYYENREMFFDYEKPSNQFHPKTLIYVLNYESSKSSKKYTILVGEDANNNTVTGYNTNDSHITEYLVSQKIKEKMSEKKGFMMPMLWACWKEYFHNGKVVFINV